jgi:MFS family permease
MENNLEVSAAETYFYFMGTCITSPISGALFSGYITKKVGGYESKYIIPVAFMASLVGCAAGIPTPLVKNFHIAISLFWVVLFVGSVILPIMTGVLLTVVEPELKEHANSIANLSYNLFGYLPAPTLYGYMNKLDGSTDEEHDKSNYGMILLLWMTVPATVCVGIVMLIKKNKTKSA